MGTPDFAGKLSILVRCIVSFRNGIGKSAGAVIFQFRKIPAAQILVASK